ncbi:hypothetical protein [Mycobacterium hubeiense]|uniref:hypothetical protein n=1 Tax=Mycobacterium hubeiense TaxID=1867256 RepID=UPI000C7F482A|nr:hypothetical protein [Mycobacterium sp. QGD 101]
MNTWLAAAVAAAAISLTYFFCVRPTLRGRGGCAMTERAGERSDRDREIAELREELRVLRAQDALDRHSPPPAGE